MNVFEGLFLTSEQLVFVKKAYFAARKAHQKINHKYDGKYDYFDTHILRTVHYAMKYIYLVPKEDRHFVLAIQFFHDGIEDAHLTYNDIKKAFGFIVAEGVYACTNEKGRTRKDRANAKYYKGIREAYLAKFVKICDRMGNVHYGIFNSGGMIDGYIKENEHFINSLKGRDTLWGKFVYWYTMYFNLRTGINYEPMYTALNNMFEPGYAERNKDEFNIGDFQWA